MPEPPAAVLTLHQKSNLLETFSRALARETHNLRRWPELLGQQLYNQCQWDGAAARDFAVRMQQFFDHFLKAGPRPEWMEKGVPYIERDEEKERFLKGVYKPD